jgi:hypothetical protein
MDENLRKIILNKILPLDKPKTARNMTGPMNWIIWPPSISGTLQFNIVHILHLENNVP